MLAFINAMMIMIIIIIIIILLFGSIQPRAVHPLPNAKDVCLLPYLLPCIIVIIIIIIITDL